MTRSVWLAGAFLLVLTACGSGAEAEPTVTAETEPTETSDDDATSPLDDSTTSTVPVSTASPPETTSASDAAVEGCAHVVGVDSRRDGTSYTFSVTVSSTETGWDKYADAWVVKTEAGDVLGERILAHPHVEEQPFTRSQSGIVIPDGVERVVVAARDSVLGFCGMEMTVDLADGST